MKKLFSLFPAIVIVFAACKAPIKNNETKFYSSEFKWTISVPGGFTLVSKDKQAKMARKGEEALEKTYNNKVINQAKNIFIFQNGRANYFQANYEPFDTSKDGNFIENFHLVNNLIYGTFVAQMKDAQVDSSSSAQTVNGLTFQTFTVVVTITNKGKMTLREYSRLFDKKQFTVAMTTTDPMLEQQLLDSWLNSKFDK